MIGPSSSHTAGALRIANLAKNILKEDVKTAVIKLHGSFALTWKGHGTDKAILAGLLGLETDDLKIRNAYQLAKKAKLDYKFIPTDLKDAYHPNSLFVEVWGETRNINILASSIGGGIIVLDKVNGIEIHYRGEYPTLVIVNKDTPGVAAKVTNIISYMGINIETMSVTPIHKKEKHRGHAVTIIGLSKILSESTIDTISQIENVDETIFLNKLY